MKQTILVTGGTGFIGSHTTVELIEAGYEVVIIDDLSNSKIEVLDGIEKITGVVLHSNRWTFAIVRQLRMSFVNTQKLKVLFILQLLRQ